MWIRGTVGSPVQSHRAKSTRTDRRNFSPKNRWRGGLTCRSAKRRRGSATLPQLTCDPSRFAGHHPQLASTALNFPTPIPIFPAVLFIAKTSVLILRMAVRDCRTIFPNFSVPFPDFSPVIPICNGLFPRALRNLLSRENREESEAGKFRFFPSPFSRPSRGTLFTQN